MVDSIAAILFADNLAYYLVRKFLNMEHYSKIPEFDELERPFPKFHDEMGSAIASVIASKKADMALCAEELLEEKFLPSNKCFAKLCLHALPHYFPEGYSPEKFIAYCAMVMGVSLDLYDSYRLNFLDDASGAVSITLIGFMLTSEFEERGGFDDLFQICYQYNRQVEISHLKRSRKSKREKFANK